MDVVERADAAAVELMKKFTPEEESDDEHEQEYQSMKEEVAAFAIKTIDGSTSFWEEVEGNKQNFSRRVKRLPSTLFIALYEEVIELTDVKMHLKNTQDELYKENILFGNKAVGSGGAEVIIKGA